MEMCWYTYYPDSLALACSPIFSFRLSLCHGFMTL